jgi:hypothetical protein
MDIDVCDENQIRQILADREVDWNAGESINILCEKLADSAELAERIEAVELCVKVIALSEPDECSLDFMLADVRKSAELLDVNSRRFLDLVQKIIPVEFCSGPSADVILGIYEGMDLYQIRERLNSEYKKWNSRVTSGDRDVSKRAEHMLKLITARRDVLFVSGLAV